jgi:hypothetical protein
MPNNKKKPMDPNEKLGYKYALKSERKTPLAVLRRKAIRDAAKLTDPAAKSFSKGASAGKNMLSKDKAAASRGGTMPVKKAAKKIARGDKRVLLAENPKAAAQYARQRAAIAAKKREPQKPSVASRRMKNR